MNEEKLTTTTSTSIFSATTTTTTTTTTTSTNINNSYNKNHHNNNKPTIITSIRNKNVSNSKLRKKFDKITFQDYIVDNSNHSNSIDNIDNSYNSNKQSPLQQLPLHLQQQNLKKKKCFYIKDEKKAKPTKLKRNIQLYNNIKESYELKKNEDYNSTDNKDKINSPSKEREMENNNNINNNNNSNGIINEAKDIQQSEKEINQLVNNNENDNDGNNNNYNINNNISYKNNKNVNIKEYINQILPNEEIDCTCKELVKVLKAFQEKSYQNNPNKPKKRYVSGLREVLKLLDVGKISCVIISSNIEENGALNELVDEIIRLCKSRKVLYTFALSSRSLGKSIGKTIKISILGILDYDGANEIYQKLSNQVKQSRDEFFKLQNIIKNHPNMLSLSTTKTTITTSNELSEYQPSEIESNESLSINTHISTTSNKSNKSPKELESTLISTLNLTAVTTEKSLNENDKIKILLERNENISEYKQVESLYKNELKRIKNEHKKKLKEFQVIRKQKEDEKDQERKRIQLQKQREYHEQQKQNNKKQQNNNNNINNSSNSSSNNNNNNNNNKKQNNNNKLEEVSDQLLYDNRYEINNNNNKIKQIQNNSNKKNKK